MANDITGQQDATPPAPTNLSAASRTHNSARITWRVASGAPTSYRYRLGSAAHEVVVYGTTAFISGLRASTTYTFSVRAFYEGLGWSSYATFTFTTKQQAPSISFNDSSKSSTSYIYRWDEYAGTSTRHIIRLTRARTRQQIFEPSQFLITPDRIPNPRRLRDSYQYKFTGLLPNTTYYAILQAENSDAFSQRRLTIQTLRSPITVPGLPNVTVVPEAGTASITLSGSSGDVFYYAYRTDTGNISGLTTGSFTLRSLRPSTQYTLYVKAVNAEGESAERSVTFTTLASVVRPTAPVLTVSNVTTSSARVSVSISHAVTTEYRLGGAGFDWTAFTGSSFDLTGLVSGSLYTVQVRGRNSVGYSNTTTTTFTTAVALQPPATPTVTVSSITSSGAAVSVTSDRATSLEYRLGTTGDFTSFSGSSFTLSNLSPSTAYTVQVRGSNSAGSSSIGSKAFTTLAAVQKPSAPTVSASSITQTTATLSWTGSATSWEWRLGTTGTWTSSTTASRNLTGLTASTSYTFQVRGINSAGTGAIGQTIFTTSAIVVTPTLVPVAPIVSVSSLTQNSAYISWPAADRAATYEYKLSTATVWTSTGSNRFATVIGLSPSTQYTIEVRGINASGNGAVGSSMFTTTAVVLLVPPAPVVSSSAVTDTTAIVSWAATARVAFYQYRINKGSWTTHTRTSVSLTRLTPATSYVIDVRGVNDSGAGLFGTTTLVTDSTAVSVPHQPTNLLIDVGSTTASVSWTAASGGATADSFEWRLGTTGVWTSTGSDTTALLTGLTVNTSYTLQVRARGQSGASEPSAILFSTLPTTAPAANTPTAPTLDSVAAGDKRLTATWSTPSSSGESPISHYEIRIGGDWENAGPGPSFTVSNLTNGTAYSVVVRAVSGVGAGAQSNSITETPRASVLIPQPSQPVGMGQPNPDFPTIATGITWTASVSNIAASDITNWKWEMQDSADPVDTFSGTVAGNRTALSLLASIDSGVGDARIPSRNTPPYRIRVRITTSEGDGPWSIWSAYRAIRVSTVPGRPGTPVLGTGDRVIRAQYDPPADTGNSDQIAIEYQIRTSAPVGGGSEPPGPSGQQAGTPMGPYRLAATPETLSYTVRHFGDPAAESTPRLENGQRYDIRHRSVTAAGAGEYSSWSSDQPTTQIRPPAGVAAPVITSQDETLSAVWDSSTADGGSPITGWAIQLRINGVEGEETNLGNYNTTQHRIGLSGSLFDFDPPTG